MKCARLFAFGLGVALMMTAWSPTASAQNNQPRKKYVATRQITIDQQTGALRLPTPEETQELVDTLVVMTNRSTDGLQVNTRANGTKSVNIDGRFQSVMLARPNADGTSETRCVDTFEEAATFLGLVEDTSR